MNVDFQKIIVWVLIWLFGYSLGLFEAWVKEKAKKDKKEPEVVQLPPQIIEEEYTLAVFENADDLSLKLEKSEFNAPGELNENQRKRLIGLVVKLRPWLEGKAAAPSQARAEAAKPVQPMPRAAVPTPAIQPASVNIASQPLSGDELEYSRLNMAGQINWLLQKKLENHPLRPRKIRLENALTGGVLFRIGEEKYEYIDEIPYPEIKGLFQEAISAWEKRSTPGL